MLERINAKREAEMRVEKIHSHRYPSPICYLRVIHWIASCLVGSLEIQELQVE